MRLTTFTDYSLRVLIHLATDPERRSTIAEIAQAYGISEHHVVKVVHRLGREGFLANTRGRHGGLRLAVPAAEIRVGQVVRAMEGEEGLADCGGGDGRARCAIAGQCRLASALDEALAAFYEVLDDWRLADLVAAPQGRAIAMILHPRMRAA